VDPEIHGRGGLDRRPGGLCGGHTPFAVAWWNTRTVENADKSSAVCKGGAGGRWGAVWKTKVVTERCM